MQLNDVVGNEDAVGRLRCIARDGNMPHLILTVSAPIQNMSVDGCELLNLYFQGAPGIGKTTCVLALAREMLGDSFKDGVLELNASDER